MTWQRSGEILVMVILGGLGTLHGAILGALAFLLLEEWLSGFTEHWKMIFGPLLVLVALADRGGIVGALAPLVPALAGNRDTAAPSRGGQTHGSCPIAPAPRPTTSDPLLRIENLSKSFGALVVSDAITLDVRPGELHALIGPNGAGKTTLIHQVSGSLASDRGRILFDGADMTSMPMAGRVHRGLARSFQITTILPEFSVLETVALAVQARSGSSFRCVAPASSERHLNDAAYDCLRRVGLSDRATTRSGSLAHGEKRLLELAIALATNARMLVLDEPLAGLARDESLAVIALLQRLKSEVTILLVEHDMDAVFQLADRISVLVYGRIIATGTPDEIRSNADVRSAYLGDEEAA